MTETAWWLSWYHHPEHGGFEYHGPWWISGYAFDPDRDIIVAAVCADNEEAAWEVIRATYDVPPEKLEERFIEHLGGKDPLALTDRFPASDWMQWPWPVSTGE